MRLGCIAIELPLVYLSDVREQLGEVNEILGGESLEIPEQRSVADMLERPLAHDANSFGERWLGGRRSAGTHLKGGLGSVPYFRRYNPTPGPIGQSNVPHSRSSSVQAMRKPIAYGIMSAMIVPIPALGS